MNESHRRIASINRIDELNHRTAFQNDPKRPVDSLMGRQDRPERAQEQPKTPSRRPKSPPRPSKEGPRDPKSGPRPAQDGPRTPQEPSWDGLGAILGPKNRKIEFKSAQEGSGSNSSKLFGSILEPQMTPQTTPRRAQNESKIKTKNASLFYRSWTRLRPVLRRSWAHLGGIFGHFALVFPMFFENRHFRTNDGSRCVFGPT